MFEPGKYKASRSDERRERMKEPKIEKYKQKAVKRYVSLSDLNNPYLEIHDIFQP